MPSSRRACISLLSWSDFGKLSDLIVQSRKSSDLFGREDVIIKYLILKLFGKIIKQRMSQKHYLLEERCKMSLTFNEFFF